MSRTRAVRNRELIGPGAFSGRAWDNRGKVQMTSILRPLPVSQTSSEVDSRLAAGARSIANVGGSPVEELGPNVGASFNDATFLAPEYERRGFDNRPEEQRLGGDASRFVTPSQSFASLLESRDGAGLNNPGIGTSGVRSKFTGLLAQAIKVYETNAKVVSGTLELPGAKLSVSF